MKKVIVVILSCLMMCSFGCSKADNNTGSKEEKTQKEVKRLKSMISRKKVGDTIEFGKYPNTSSGTEDDIVWVVLEKDEDNKTILVATRDVIDAMRFNSEITVSKNDSLDETSRIEWLNTVFTYKDSDIRKWLNESFMNSFSEVEKKLIAKTSIQLSDNESVNDQVFLLSSAEKIKYSKVTGFRIQRHATGYAFSKGLTLFNGGKGRGAKSTNSKYNPSWYCTWWLRNTKVIESKVNGHVYGYVYVVSRKDGKVYEMAFPTVGWQSICGVRPAMRLTYDEES